MFKDKKKPTAYVAWRRHDYDYDYRRMPVEVDAELAELLRHLVREVERIPRAQEKPGLSLRVTGADGVPLVSQVAASALTTVTLPRTKSTPVEHVIEALLKHLELEATIDESREGHPIVLRSTTTKGKQ